LFVSQQDSTYLQGFKNINNVFSLNADDLLGYNNGNFAEC